MQPFWIASWPERLRDRPPLRQVAVLALASSCEDYWKVDCDTGKVRLGSAERSLRAAGAFLCASGRDFNMDFLPLQRRWSRESYRRPLCVAVSQARLRMREL